MRSDPRNLDIAIAATWVHTANSHLSHIISFDSSIRFAGRLSKFEFNKGLYNIFVCK